MATASIASPVSRLRTYASFVRFEHTLFSLPLMLAGIFSAPGPALAPSRWAWIALAAVAARTAAMSLNRIIDRRIDALNPRTRARELPAGRMSSAEALGLLLVSVVLYLVACRALDPVRLWYLRVSVVPLAVFAAYPYLKRWTPLCHFGVGLSLALAPLAGYAAAHPDLAMPWPALGLAAFAFFWVSGFDVIYATLDEEFDRAHGIHSLVAWLGRTPALQISAGLHLMAFGALAMVAAMSWALAARPQAGGATIVAGAAILALLLATSVLLFLEQRWAENVNLAFFKVNVWVGVAVLLMVLAGRFLG